MNVKKQIQDLLLTTNRMFHKNYLYGDRDSLLALYEESKNHLAIKLFELEIVGEQKYIIDTAFHQLLEKHLMIFYRVHCLHEDPQIVIPEVANLTEDQLEDLKDLLL